ncbi:2,5-didehydrogluconate reductase DkgB [uncultured Cobetia sp.]|jgi:2,5-diketo-D-gluconate reductase B|uniref:2,5-didehydrogluconate reductase DkgB n=1 Tax=uncultured Cobetia sp. TaxID=410706 RepID=UPI0030ECF2F2|tara:strand:+ start:1176 stop:1982 length:807 start_codon:yes stop_codon:yes gene_type:complete
MSTTLPNPGFGTYRIEGETLRDSLNTALEIGYRHFDTAQFYGNEAEVGQIIADSKVPREELFITTKIWHDRLVPGDMEKSVEESLERLQMDYVDLLLIHWPSPNDEVPMEDYLPVLAKLKAAGKARHIGVSNFTGEQLERAVGIVGRDELLTNQIEVHPFLQNRKVIDKCHELGIEVTAFMPLAVGKVMDDDTLKAIAERHDASPAQIALAWLKMQDIVTFPSSTKAKNIESNFEAFSMSLTGEDMAKIAELDRGERIANPDFAPDWD